MARFELHEQGKRLYPGRVHHDGGGTGSRFPDEGTHHADRSSSTAARARPCTFQNTPLNAIIVEKYDSVTGEALPGCTFQLRFLGGTSGTGGTAIGQKVTGKNGTAIWTGPDRWHLYSGRSRSGGWVQHHPMPLKRSTWRTVVSRVSSPSALRICRTASCLIRKVCSVNPSVTLPGRGIQGHVCGWHPDRRQQRHLPDR